MHGHEKTRREDGAGFESYSERRGAQLTFATCASCAGWILGAYGVCVSTFSVGAFS